jgi:hypothetical protein
MKSSHMVGTNLLLACWLLVSAGAAHAGDDGNYCTGKGYIAFDLRTVGPPDHHVLRVFRFEPGRGIYKVGDWPIGDFGVRAMWCNGDRVVLSGVAFESQREEIDITGDKKRELDLNKPRPEDAGFLPEEGNLGISPPKVVVLQSPDTEHKYQLRFSHSSKGFEDTSKAELLQIDSHQRISQRVLLYEVRRDVSE